MERWDQVKERIGERLIKPDQVVGILKEVEELPTTYAGRCDPCYRLVQALEWVHENIKYVSDLESTGYIEYWKEPWETLRDREGDCDDMAFLLASIIAWKRVQMRVAYGDLEGTWHIWIEARPNGRYPWMLLDASRGKHHELRGRYPSGYTFAISVYDGESFPRT